MQQKVTIQRINEMNTRQMRVYSALLFSGLSLTFTFMFWWFQPQHIPHNFSGALRILDFALFFALSYVVWYQIINEVFSWLIATQMKKVVPLAPEKNLRVALITAFVPGSEPIDILEKTMIAMKEVDYPHDTWILDEGDDEQAKILCKKYDIHHFTRKNDPRYNSVVGPFRYKTKGGNYNAWFYQHSHSYDIVAQHDVDFIPKKKFLTKTLGYFRDQSVAFVGSPQIYGNISDSWIAKGAAEQAYGFYGVMQKGFFGLDMNLFIGANHVLRVRAHEDIGGYSGHIVEDHLTGMHLYSKKWKSVYISEVLAVGEGPSTWGAYFSQQMRWAYGLIDILLKHSPKVFKKMKLSHKINYFILQQYYFYGLAQIIAIVLLTTYFIFGLSATNMKLTPLLLLYLPVIGIQLIIFLWTQKFYIERKKESGFHMSAKLLNLAVWPIYFLAFICVLVNKRLNYKVTPKGAAQKVASEIRLFIPHFLLGFISIIGMAVATGYGHTAPQLIFWGVIISLIMFGFFLSELLQGMRYRVIGFYVKLMKALKSTPKKRLRVRYHHRFVRKVLSRATSLS